MDILIHKNHLYNGLQQVTNIISGINDFNQIFLETESQSIILTTINLDLKLSCTIKAKIFKEIKIIIPAQKLLNMIKLFTSEFIELTLKESILIIKNKKLCFKIRGKNDKKLSNREIINQDKVCILQQKDLLKILKEIIYSKSTDTNRYILNSICIIFKNNKIYITATDGRRLSISSLPIQNINSSKLTEQKFILPGKAALELQKALIKGPTIKLIFNEKQAIFEIDIEKEISLNTGLMKNIKLYSKVIKSFYPDYHSLIPTDNLKKILLNKDFFIKSLKRISLISNSEDKTIKLIMYQNTLKIYAYDHAIGEGYDISLIKYNGPKTEILFNPHYLMEVLKNLEEKEIFFKFNNNFRPCLIATKSTFLGIIMPIKFK